MSKWKKYKSLNLDSPNFLDEQDSINHCADLGAFETNIKPDEAIKLNLAKIGYER